MNHTINLLNDSLDSQDITQRPGIQHSWLNADSEPNPIDETVDKFHSQLKEKLEVRQGFSADVEASLDEWSQMKFKFATRSIMNQLDPEFIIRMNSDTSRRRVTAKLTKIDKPQESVPEITTIAKPKPLPIPELDAIFGSDECKQKLKSPVYDLIVEDFVSQHFDKYQVLDEEHELSEAPPKPVKLTEAELEGFFKSLEDNLQQKKFDPRSSLQCQASLSASARKIRRKNIPSTSAEFNNIVARIINPEPASQPMEIDFIKCLQKENVPVETSHNTAKRIMFKDQIASIKQLPPASPVKQQPTTSSRALDGYDFLANKFKLDLAKKPNMNASTSSTINSFSFKQNRLQLRPRSTAAPMKPANAEDNIREEMLKKSKEDLKTHKNVNKYFDELCFIRFNDL